MDTFKQVQLVKEKISGATYAMKVMRKADIVKNPDVSSCSTRDYLLKCAALRIGFPTTSTCYMM